MYFDLACLFGSIRNHRWFSKYGNRNQENKSFDLLMRDLMTKMYHEMFTNTKNELLYNLAQKRMEALGNQVIFPMCLSY